MENTTQICFAGKRGQYSSISDEQYINFILSLTHPSHTKIKIIKDLNEYDKELNPDLYLHTVTYEYEVNIIYPVGDAIVKIARSTNQSCDDIIDCLTGSIISEEEAGEIKLLAKSYG